MGEVLPAAGVRFQAEAEVLIVGAGACGLTAALAARDAGGEALLLERDETPSGSTALSSGFVPAAPTRFQAAIGVKDSAAMLAEDIQRKAKGMAVQSIVDLVASASGPAIEWLADAHGIDWVVLEDFLYPYHSRHRMHAVPEKTGEALMARLLAATGSAGVPVATQAHVTGLYRDGDVIRGVRVTRPDGAEENLACRSLILACNGFGGNRTLVKRHIPEIAGALYFGHEGNQGDALGWGEGLNAASAHLSAYQGHGSVATPHGVLITWAVMMEGGIQVNALGARFSNEHEGYSEQAVRVLAQPGGIAWNIYDARLHELAMGFEDYRTAVQMGAVRTGADAGALAAATELDAGALEETLAATAAMARGDIPDPLGRDFTTKPALAAPFHAVKVTGALFHTQGGLLIDEFARVQKRNGSAFPNLFAGGGAACGVSGPEVWGYLSGNGLLSAMALGSVAGRNAAF